ncbi:hypothetical protein B4077_1802 [Bacillus cereus]|uniref:Uncharacterized protein n=1 Tax=Bacillus cereus TaxID=1396 RepID=A0A0G8F104_BACCE|nr:hypothetical protein B4077_1802 [Bacillus cereus]
MSGIGSRNYRFTFHEHDIFVRFSPKIIPTGLPDGITFSIFDS